MDHQVLDEFRFAVVVRGQDLCFDQLNNLFEMESVRAVKKGEEINHLPLIVAEEDEWTGSIMLTTPDAEDVKLNALLAQMIVKKDVLNELCKSYNVTLRLYVRSDRAKIAYKLMPETLAHLVAVGLPIELTTFSWGEVI